MLLPKRKLQPWILELIDLAFAPSDRAKVRRLLSKRQPWDSWGIERLRVSAIKLSRGSIKELKKAIRLGKEDPRDLFVEADFAGDVWEHEKWEPEWPTPSDRSA